MSDHAYQIQYRQEFIAGFEQRMSLVRDTVTTEVQVKGNQAVFLVADSGHATAVTRGLNGNIPARADNLTQNTATLVEWHDLVEKTGFNIFASQGDQKRIMQETSMGVINRRIDKDIITELQNGTQYNGTTAAVGSLAMFMSALTILGSNEVPIDGNISALITPACFAYLMQTKEFASAQYTDRKPFSNVMMKFTWAGINFIVHPNLPGKATSNETCFLYHKSAIGNAAPADLINAEVGYEGKHQKSWARSSIFIGSKLLQNGGLVLIRHDGSKYAATA